MQTNAVATRPGSGGRLCTEPGRRDVAGQDLEHPARRINEIVHGKRAITADTALRLARFFGTSAEFWLNFQAHYDLEVQRDNVGPRLEREVEVFAPEGRVTFDRARVLFPPPEIVGTPGTSPDSE